LGRRLTFSTGRVSVVLKQSRVNFLGGQAREAGIIQRTGRKRKAIVENDRIDRKIGSFVPKPGIAASSSAMMCKSAVHDLVRKYALKLCRRQRLDKAAVVENQFSICRHGWNVAWDELESEAERTEEWLIQQKLCARLSELPL